MTGSQGPAAAGGDRLRAGYADREQVVEVLKTAFTQGRLTVVELDTRTGQALAARTYAELNAVAEDIPGAPRLGGQAAAPAPGTAGAEIEPPTARGWPLAKAAVKSGGLLVLATVIAYTGNMIDNSDPNGTGPGPHHGWTRLLLLLTLSLMLAAVFILLQGVATSLEQRRSRKQLPPPQGRVATP